jgi:hypothetical protein
VGSSSFSEGFYFSSTEFSNWAAYVLALNAVNLSDWTFRSRGDTQNLRAIRSF